MAKQVFISYSHQDDRWRKRLATALAPYARNDEIALFDDSMIRAGSDWQSTLDREMDRANVAVLLVSANFLASEFVARVELPHILERAQRGGLTVTWVPVSASAWEITPLKSIQAAVSPARPLDQMTRPDADAALVQVAAVIAGARTLTDIGRAMQTIDKVFSDTAPAAGIDASVPRSIQAHHTGTSVAFERRDTATPIDEITGADLERLPPDQHRLIGALQENMQNEFDRWTALYPRRKTLTPAELVVFEDAGREMCAELSRILDFIRDVLHKSLQDHYESVRWSCATFIKTSG